MPRSLARLVSVLALVLGVVAMHGLVGAGHAGHLAGPGLVARDHAGSGGHDAGADGATLAAHLWTTDLSATGPASTDLSAAVLRHPGASLAVAGGLCVAVLLAALALLHRRRGYALDLLRPPTVVGPGTARTSPPRRGPPRLLLAELCVLRT